MGKLMIFPSSPSGKSENSLSNSEISINQPSEMSLTILSQGRKGQKNKKKKKALIKSHQHLKLAKKNRTSASEQERLPKMQNRQEIFQT